MVHVNCPESPQFVFHCLLSFYDTSMVASVCHTLQDSPQLLSTSSASPFEGQYSNRDSMSLGTLYILREDFLNCLNPF